MIFSGGAAMLSHRQLFGSSWKFTRMILASSLRCTFGTVLSSHLKVWTGDGVQLLEETW